MNRPGSFSLVSFVGGALLLLAAGGCSGGSGAAFPRPPIVVFLILDTLSAKHVTHLGYDRATTPNIDALAAEGATFEQVISPASYTVASVPSIITGRLPDRHGLTWYDRRLSNEERTLAELAREAGYQTYAILGMLNGGPIYGNMQGFEDYFEVYLGPGPEGREAFVRRQRTVHMVKADEFIPVAERRLDKLGEGEQLLLHMHLLEPHSPYDPPAPFSENFKDERYSVKPPPLQNLPHEVDPGEEIIQGVIQEYDANISYVDHHVGLLMDLLRERGLYNEALVVLTADHGEAFWEHGVLGHGRRVYEEEVHVPLVVKFPKSWGRTGLRVSGLASTLDIVPTMCEWLGLEEPELPLDGYSLERLLEDPEAVRPEPILLRSRRDFRRFGLRLGDKKAIVYFPEEADAEPVCELYDLASDPLELNDLAPERPEEAARFTAEILTRLKELEDGLEEAGGEFHEADLDLLEALGYAGVEEETPEVER